MFEKFFEELREIRIAIAQLSNGHLIQSRRGIAKKFLKIDSKEQLEAAEAALGDSSKEQEFNDLVSV